MNELGFIFLTQLGWLWLVFGKRSRMPSESQAPSLSPLRPWRVGYPYVEHLGVKVAAAAPAFPPVLKAARRGRGAALAEAAPFQPPHVGPRRPHRPEPGCMPTTSCKTCWESEGQESHGWLRCTRAQSVCVSLPQRRNVPPRTPLQEPLLEHLPAGAWPGSAGGSRHD